MCHLCFIEAFFVFLYLKKRIHKHVTHSVNDYFSVKDFLFLLQTMFTLCFIEWEVLQMVVMD